MPGILFVSVVFVVCVIVPEKDKAAVPEKVVFPDLVIVLASVWAVPRLLLAILPPANVKVPVPNAALFRICVVPALRVVAPP